jgi:hypothetical protein
MAIKVTFLDNTTVYANHFEGNINKHTSFNIKKILGKPVSLGYNGGFSKHELGIFIQQLKEVYDRMEDITDEDKSETNITTNGEGS